MSEQQITITPLQNMMNFLLKPIATFRRNFSNGDQLYQYLYYQRSGLEGRILKAINNGSNVTVIGNPGHGKTSLMNYVWIEIKKNEKIFPIFIDYSAMEPREPETLLVEFIVNMRDYFFHLGIPDGIHAETTFSNAKDHLRKVTSLLHTTTKDKLSKKLVIYLDDLDYAEDCYFTILNKYFLSYAASDKAVVILSCRAPLYNDIKKHDSLRQYYHIQPVEIKIPDDDIQQLITHRLKTLMKDVEEESVISRILKVFKKKATDDQLLEIAKTQGISYNDPDELIINKLPFGDDFYSYLGEITFWNFRNVEELFPIFFDYEIKGEKPSFNENFIEAYIQNTYSKEHILLDLVKEKTTGTKYREKDNSILQIVLEYFYFNQVKDENFYRNLTDYGIKQDLADKALDKLIKTPFNLLEPECCLDGLKSQLIHERYEINRKGIIYVEEILRNPIYYQKKSLLKSARSYFEERNKLSNRKK